MPTRTAAQLRSSRAAGGRARRHDLPTYLGAQRGLGQRKLPIFLHIGKEGNAVATHQVSLRVSATWPATRPTTTTCSTTWSRRLGALGPVVLERLMAIAGLVSLGGVVRPSDSR
eukprot:3203926-Prymnesium_polylepis.1